MRFFRMTLHFENSSHSVSLRLPMVSMRVWKWGTGFIRLGLVLLLVQAGVLFSYDHLKGKAIEERRFLYSELNKEQKKLDALNEKMDARFEDEDLLHLKFGLSPADRSSREMAMGGPQDPLVRLRRETTPILDYSLTLAAKSEQLEAKASRNEENFASIAGFIEQQYAHWSHIPSVSPTAGRYASPFGPRIHPVTGEIGKMHFGIDIANGRWTPVYATADGVIAIARRSESFGNFIEIDHGNGYLTKFGHLQAFAVKPGQFVKRYQLLGYMGNTGLSAGPHLHYEVWYSSRAENPLRYILPGEYAVQ
ncbi:MAG: M23 family metallopeptidase [Fibrobacteraceae bacterium]